MKLTWCGHSCFLLESRSGSVVFDPYAPGSVPGLVLPTLRADAVICSHEHADHFYPEGVELSGRKPDFEIRQFDCWHDDARGAKRGKNMMTLVEADGLRVYSCPSCGAELICDQSTAATACPYCGNPAIVPGQFSGALRPDYILPFRLSKDDAVQALRAHYKGKPFLPRSFTSANHIEQIQGVYVPFWLFDGGAEGAASYRASNTNVYETGDYEITETRHYHVVRAGSLAFEKIPVDASSKMPDDHMDSIETFDYAQLRPFSTAYLPGYLADKYDVTIDDSRDRADTRCRETLAQALRDTVTGYGACVTEREDIALRRGKVHYALLPVWMLHTKWQGKDYLFAMNGQTGKLVGDLPVDKRKVAAWFAGISVPLMILLAFLL